MITVYSVPAMGQTVGTKIRPFPISNSTLNLNSSSHVKTQTKMAFEVSCSMVRGWQTMYKCCRGWQDLDQGSANYGLWANLAYSLLLYGLQIMFFYIFKGL